MKATKNKQPMSRSSKNLISGLIFGVGTMGFIDEVVFHQLLRWHHFYDLSTTDIGIISDGLFHAFSWFATIGGLFMFADLRRRNDLIKKRWVGGFLTGMGAFQLYDGLIHHKVMQIHQIRYVDNLIVYDLIWNGFALAVLLAGIYLLLKTKGRE